MASGTQWRRSGAERCFPEGKWFLLLMSSRMVWDTVLTQLSETRFLPGSQVHYMKSVDQEEQPSCPQFWRIQSALRCDSHRTRGCPENLKWGGKRECRGEKKNKGKQSENVLRQYCDYSMTPGQTMDLFWVNFFSFSLSFLFSCFLGMIFVEE